MTSVSTTTERLENFSPVDVDILGVEDCQYLLRALERRAFEHVVSALRAQGPLSQYKEIILDHLKTIFCISDEDFLLRIRITSSDPILSKIAQELNPSYDTFMEWYQLGLKPDDIDFSEIIKMGMEPNKHLNKIQQQMISKMQTHNASIEAEKDKISELIHLPKRSYVPEKLRQLLYHTENDVNNRVDILREKARETNKGPKEQILKPTFTRHVGRPRRAEILTSPGENDLNKNKISPNSTKNSKNVNDNHSVFNNDIPLLNSNITSSMNNLINNISTLKENGNNLQKQKFVPKIDDINKNKEEFSVHYSAGAKTFVVDPEDQNSGKESKHKKRRSKLVDDGTFVCARVQPFLFSPAVDGQSKPPRGNPDKRTTKRPINQVFSSTSNESLYSPPSLGGTFYTNNYIQDDYLINKRTRTVSTGGEMCDSRNFSKSLSSLSKTSNVISGALTHYPSNHVRAFVDNNCQIVSVPGNSRFPSSNSITSSSIDINENHYRKNVVLPVTHIYSTYSTPSANSVSSLEGTSQQQVLQISMVHGGDNERSGGRTGLECNEQIIFEPTEKDKQQEHYLVRKQHPSNELFIQQQLPITTTVIQRPCVVSATSATPQQIVVEQSLVKNPQQIHQTTASYSSSMSTAIPPVANFNNNQNIQKNERATSILSSPNLLSPTTSIQSRIITTIGTTTTSSVVSNSTVSSEFETIHSSGASGLDFLASTASLFTKMERGGNAGEQKQNSATKITIPPKVAVTTAATTVYSQEAPNISRVITNNKTAILSFGTTTNPLATTTSIPAAMSCPTKSYQKNVYISSSINEPSASSSTISSTTLNRRYYSTMKPTTNIPSSSLKPYNSNQATQDFFKQQVDKGIIDQGVTLGSILANPNLRSKLFNAANQSARD